MYLHRTDYKFKHVYNMNTLKDYLQYAEHDIKRCEDHIKKIREYQAALFTHAQEVAMVETKPVVVLSRRENYTTKKKEYNVYVEIRPMVEHKSVDGQLVYGIFKDQQNFAGTERHQAIKYAETLAKQYNAEIEKAGYWR